MSENWQPGDRVQVLLPDRLGLLGRRGSRAWFRGTVRAVDEPGALPGVRVDLDMPVSGVQDCYASHKELRPVTR